MMRRSCALAAAACLATTWVSDAFAQDQLTITDAFARANLGSSSAAYMTIANAGAEDDVLIAASTPMAGRVELHGMAVDDDVMRMGAVGGGIAVPAHGTVSLEPGSLHIMLMGITEQLVEGGTLRLTLTFEHAGEMTLDVPILAPGADSADMGEHEHGN